MPSALNTTVHAYFLHNLPNLGALSSFFCSYPAWRLWHGHVAPRDEGKKNSPLKNESSKTLSKLGWPAVDGQIVMKSPSQDIVFLWYYMEGDQILHYVSISSRGLLLLGLHLH